MRSHGYPSFPDPDPNGVFNLPSTINANSAQFGSATSACQSKTNIHSLNMRQNGNWRRFVSGTEAREQAAGPVAPPQAIGGRSGPVRPGGAGGGHRGGRRRRVAAMLAGVVVVAAGSVAALAAAGVFSRPGHPGSGGTRGTATQVVSRQTLISQTAVNATLGYAGSYTVTGRAPGTVTWLPAPGRVIREGGVLYRTGNGVPTYLLYGRVPAWRTLRGGYARRGRAPAQP